MKFEAILAAVAISMAFLSGSLLLSVRDRAPGLEPVVVEKYLKRYMSDAKSLSEWRAQPSAEFVDPKSLLPSFEQHDFASAVRLARFEKTCRPAGRNGLSKSLEKAWLWQEFKCGLRKRLPERFLETPPYFHPSGKSYALLMNSGSEHRAYFHVQELAASAEITVEEPWATLASLRWEELHGLTRADDVVLSEKSVLIKHLERDQNVYRIFPRGTWDEFWSRTPFRPTTFDSADRCFVKQGSVCWRYDVTSIMPWSPALLLLVASIASTLILFVLLTSRIRRRRLEEERLKFALQMLTHELRTPLTNLSLNVDRFRAKFDELPESAQSFMLGIFDQVERLRRVTDNSQQYLSKDLTTSLLAPRFCEITSLGDFIRHTLEPYREHIELEIEDDGRSWSLDPYWVSICIKNLVENALRHGLKPVRVSLRTSHESWAVEVEDQGMSIFDPMKRGSESQGMGVGFRLVQKIAPLVRGRVRIRFAPTRIRIEFSEGT